MSGQRRRLDEKGRPICRRGHIVWGTNAKRTKAGYESCYQCQALKQREWQGEARWLEAYVTSVTRSVALLERWRDKEPALDTSRLTAIGIGTGEESRVLNEYFPPSEPTVRLIAAILPEGAKTPWERRSLRSLARERKGKGGWS